MRVIVLGASGATGRGIVAAALRRGWAVTAFVRDPAKLGVAGAAVVRGDVGDAAAVAKAIAGHDAVVSALGVGRPLKPDPVVVQGVHHIIEGMRQHGVRRLLYLSFIGVRASRAAAGFLIAHVARHPLRHEIADHELKEAAVERSDLDWTIVRPPKLTNGAATNRYRAGDDIVAGSFFPRLSRADVADFMIAELAEPRFVRRAVRLLP